METVGDRPSLRFEVNIARAQKMYPMDETPVPVPGYQFVAGRVAGRGTYDERNKPFVDFNALVAVTDETRWASLSDDRGFANIILGRGIPPPDPSNKGHYHEESPGVLVHPARPDPLHDRRACKPSSPTRATSSTCRSSVFTSRALPATGRPAGWR